MDIQTLTQQSVDAALHQDWQKAVLLNEQILRLEPDNVDALNRLGRAFMEIGEKGKAKKLFKKTLTIDSINVIAKKNLENIDKRGFASPKLPSEDGHAFVKEPGTDLIVEIETNASPLRIRKLAPGDILSLEKRSNKFAVFGPNKFFIGNITDELSDKMKKALKQKTELSGTFVSSKENVIKFILKGSAPLFKEKARQEIRAYALPEEIPDQPALDQSPIEERSDADDSKPHSNFEE
jgi:tetratricopeptide (TPR) repeat protein